MITISFYWFRWCSWEFIYLCVVGAVISPGQTRRPPTWSWRWSQCLCWQTSPTWLMSSWGRRYSQALGRHFLKSNICWNVPSLTGVLRLGVTHLVQSSGCPLYPTPVWILSFSFSSPPTLSCPAVLTGPARRTGRTSVRPPGTQSVSQDAFRSIFSVRFKTRKLDSTTTTTTTQLHDEAHELNNL